jgi:hypothetical protein
MSTPLVEPAVRGAVVAEGRGPFRRLRTRLEPGPAGTVLVELELPAAAVEVEWLHPFSWDAGDRGVRVRSRQLCDGDEVCLHAGPYGTADAVAHAAGEPMRFPTGGEGHRYLAGDEPGPEDRHQDTAAWVVVEAQPPGPAAPPVSLVLAWEYSGHLVTRVRRHGDRLLVTSLLPADTFAPTRGSDLVGAEGPVGWFALVDGGREAAAAALRTLVSDEMVTAPDLTGMPGTPDFPCLVANSWGVGEDTSTARILRMLEATAAVGAEVFVVDKGWERAVGDWHPNDRFAEGLRMLSDRARERGLGFGVWCGWGNADPASAVAGQHPEWLARWRGDLPRLSSDNHALCLGHDPARDWVLGELGRLVEDFGLTWLLHDFETIARCDRDDHTHDPGAGEHAAEQAFHHILRTLAERYPQVVLENCWNGVRPLDLAMVRSHHTTITEDHCRAHENALAKVGLGRYLPLSWQSAYMGAEDLPPRARVAPYVIGGPWVFMDDPETWSEETRSTLLRAVEVYKDWRGALVHASVGRPAVTLEPAVGAAGPDGVAPDGVDAVLATVDPRTAYLAVSVPAGARSVRLDLGLAPGSWTVTDAWTGSSADVLVEDGTLHRPVEPAGDGLLLALQRR